MSTILKALDRLERERGASRAGPRGPEALPPAPPSPPPGRRGRAALAVAAALVAGAALGAGFLVLWPAGRSAGPEPAAPVAAPGPAAARAAPALPPPEVAAAAPALSDAGPAPEPAPEPGASEFEVEADLPAVEPGPAPELAAAPHELPPDALQSEVAVVEPRAERVPVGREPSDEVPVAVVAPPPPAARSAERAAPPPAVPDFAVARTVWHPLRERRLAVVELRGERGARELREGDRLGPLRVRQIDPSSVLFELDGQTLRRRVGTSLE